MQFKVFVAVEVTATMRFVEPPRLIVENKNILAESGSTVSGEHILFFMKKVRLITRLHELYTFSSWDFRQQKAILHKLIVKNYLSASFYSRLLYTAMHKAFRHPLLDGLKQTDPRFSLCLLSRYLTRSFCIKKTVVYTIKKKKML